MRVEVWISNDMFRFKGTDVTDYARSLRFIYEDKVSETPKAAAERLWLVTNGVISLLNPEDLELRTEWDKQIRGFTFGAGDAVFAEGQVIECTSAGFVKGETRDGLPHIGIPPK